MPRYEIEVYELYISKIIVEADDAPAAVQKCKSGQGTEIVNGSLEFIEMADMYAVSAEHASSHPKIRQELVDADTNLAGIYSVELNVGHQAC
jgi:hypothetical protein